MTRIEVWGRLTGALLAGGVVAALVVPRTVEYVQADVVPDMGERGLVIVEAPPAPRDWTLRTWLKMEDEGSHYLTISAHSPPPEGEDWKPFTLPLTITIVGTDVEEVTCEGIESDLYGVDEFGEATRQAVLTDLGSQGIASALSPVPPAPESPSEAADAEVEGGPPNEGLPAPEPPQVNGIVMNVEVWAENKPWQDDSDVQTDEDASYIWTVKCELPANMVTGRPRDTTWPRSRVEAVYPPQINLVSVQEESEGGRLGTVDSYASVARRDKLILEESYPDASLTVNGWNQRSQGQTHTLSTGPMQYTLPGTFIFSQRGWADSRALELALLSAGYGFMGTSLAVVLQAAIVLLLWTESD